MVEPKTIDVMLASHPFFEGLDEEHIKLIAGCGQNKHFKEGEFLLREGEDADYFYVLRKGRVAVQIDAVERGALTIQTASKGEVVGWSWLIPPYKARFNVRALGDVMATALDGKCLRQKCEDDPAMGFTLIKRFSAMLTQRLEQTRLQLLDVYGKRD